MQMNGDPKFSDSQKSTMQMVAIVEARLGLPPLAGHERRIARLRPHLPSPAVQKAWHEARNREYQARKARRQAEWEDYKRKSESRRLQGGKDDSGGLLYHLQALGQK